MISAKEIKPSGSKGRRKWLWILVILLSAFLLFTYVPTRTGGSDVLTMARNEQGEVEITEGCGGSGIHLFIGGHGTRNVFEHSTTTVDYGSQTRFSSRRIWMLYLSDHCLVQQTGRILQEYLAGLPFVEEVTSFPVGNPSLYGKRLPDLYVTLDLGECSVLHLPGSAQVDALVKITMTDSLWSSERNTFDDLSPPLSHVEFRGTMNHESGSYGLISASATYQQAAGSIAGAIGQDLKRQMEEWNEKFGSLAKSPDYLFGTYREPEGLSRSGWEGIEPAITGVRLFLHNESVWRFQGEGDAAQVLDGLADELEKAGWKDRYDLGSNAFRMCREPCEVKVARVEYDVPGFMLNLEDLKQGKSLPEPMRGQVASYMLCYRHRFSRPEMDAAMERLLTSSVPPAELIPFYHNMGTGQCDQLMARLEEGPLTDPAACLALAKLYHEKRKDDEKARRMLRRAVIIYSCSQWSYSEAEDDLKALAKNLGDETLTDPPSEISRELVKDLDALELTLEMEPLQKEICLQENVFLFLPGRDKPDTVYCFRVVPGTPPKEDQARFYLYVLKQAGNRGSTKMPFQQVGGSEGWSVKYGTTIGIGVLYFDAVQIPDAPERFAVEVRMKKLGTLD